MIQAQNIIPTVWIIVLKFPKTKFKFSSSTHGQIVYMKFLNKVANLICCSETKKLSYIHIQITSKKAWNMISQPLQSFMYFTNPSNAIHQNITVITLWLYPLKITLVYLQEVELQFLKIWTPKKGDHKDCQTPGLRQSVTLVHM